ncbi:MAG: D-alanyl-D-alanine carboxypeptidase, partial [Actinobacteria bacterium]|nr:D-alanyl-D-alanine carboxypeptidase [Actinomycetota bacterium]
EKYHRAWSPYLESQSMAALNKASGGFAKSVVIKYSHMYAGDISALSRYFRSKGTVPKFVEISQAELSNQAGTLVASVSSPSIADMVKFALTWSDNLLAERLARAGAHAAGLPMSDIGVRDAILKMLSSLGVDPSGLYIHDGSGLSKEDRVTASLMAHVLIKLRLNPRYNAIYEGMPVAGLTGTLEGRFFSTAPEAIGLVHAKTGTLDGTVSLAGYVDAGDREYIFVAIADRIRKGTFATDQARNTIDHLLGKIASPLTVAR